jgi:ABC-2 type transport system permease protein
MLLGPMLFAVVGLVLVILDILMMRWIIATFDRERVVASFL